MKHFIFRLEITDGEHGYFSSSICEAGSMDKAIQLGGRAAKNWYVGEKTNKLHKPGDYPEYEFPYMQVICKVDQVEEIPAADYEILAKYPGYI